jgi:4-hydroxy-tetrahydrodipicolinate reductase
MLNLLITGRSGRMGLALLEAANAEPQVTVAATHDSGEDIDAAMRAADCTIDFSHHSFTGEVVRTALAQGKPLVIGTTGHSPEELAQIHEASRSVPLVHASNFSVGVNTLFWLTKLAAGVLKADHFDIEVVEMHHRHKIDAPSGTALTLLSVLEKAVATCHEPQTVHGRSGNTGARRPGEIGMHSLRGGDVVGDHTVVFAADGERVELTHKASSRLTFAAGAVRAALWLKNQPPGLYDMRDVLGLA